MGVTGITGFSNRISIDSPQLVQKEVRAGKKVPAQEKIQEEVKVIVDDHVHKQEVVEDLHVRSLFKDNSLKVRARLEGEWLIAATVDTGAECTIVAEEVVKQFKVKPPVLRKVKMHAAGQGQSFIAEEIGPLDIKIGEVSLKFNAFVAPIRDPMLLGVDLLKKLKARIDVSKKEIQLEGGGTLPLTQSNRTWDPGSSKSCQVKLKGRVRVPARTASMVKIQLQETTNSPFSWIEPNKGLPVLAAGAVYEETSAPKVCFMNVLDRAVILKKGTVIGTLHPLELEDFKVMKEEEEAEEGSIKVNQVKKEEGTEQMLPEHVKGVYERSKNNLSKQEQERLKEILIEYADTFAKDEFDLGSFDEIKHTIDTGDARPVKLGLRRTPIQYVEHEDEHLQKMLDAGIVSPSCSDWAAAPVLLKKKDGSIRWAVDYRKLNSVTRKDNFPLPLMSECMDALHGNMWYSKLDMASAYWQIKLDEESKHKTAFRTRAGLFEFNVLPFGLSNSGAIYSRAMSLVLAGLSWRCLLSFLDDICLLGRSTEEHFKNLVEVLKRFRKHNLKLKPKKCDLFQPEVEFLGRKVGRNGMTLTDHSIDTIQKWETPKNAKEVESFIGLASFHREFIKDFAKIAEPLHRITRKCGEKIKFQWEEKHEESFRKLKEALVSPQILAAPSRDPQDLFILETDASDEAIGGQLLQVQKGKRKVIGYASFGLTPVQRKMCTTRKELFSVLRHAHHFRYALAGARKFKVITDHSSLTWLLKFRNIEGQLGRWFEELSRYNMEIEHRPGSKHAAADALSRRPITGNCPHYKENVELKSLPCGGCKYCSKHHENWNKFSQEVDYVTELGTEVRRVQKKKERMEKYAGTGMTGMDIVVSNIEDVDWFGNEKKKVNAVEMTKEVLVVENKDIKEAQERDPELKFLIDWLDEYKEPSKEDLMLSGKAEKYYWLNKDIFFRGDEDELIYKRGEEKDLLVIPKEMKKEVLRMCHDVRSAAHQSEPRTKARIKESFFWHKISRDVKEYVMGCSSCNRNKNDGKKNRHPMVIFHAGIPMEKIHIDFIGPLPETKNGNKHILSMTDNFTKWIELVPLKNQEAETTARAAVNEFFSRFGNPSALVSDQGSNFESTLFKEMCKLLQIHKMRTSGYRPSANGQAERGNRSALAAVRAFISDKQDDWDEHLPLIASALRSAVNRHTGQTANKMMLGREAYTPANLAFGTSRGEAMEADEYVIKLEKGLQEAHETARKTLKVNLKTAKKNYDFKGHSKVLKKGDPVYCLDNSVKKGKSKKLKPLWKGPGLIMKVLTPFLYLVRLKNQEKEDKVMNHDQTKLCTDAQESWPKWLIKQKKALDEEKKMTYCICGSTEDQSFMVQCGTCLEWFHGACIKITKTRATREPYVCDQCRRG